MTCLAPARHACGVRRRDVEPPQLYDEAEAFDIGRTVLAVAVLPAAGTREEPALLVEPQRVRADSELARQLTDPHASNDPPRAGVRQAPRRLP